MKYKVEKILIEAGNYENGVVLVKENLTQIMENSKPLLPIPVTLAFNSNALGVITELKVEDGYLKATVESGNGAIKFLEIAPQLQLPQGVVLQVGLVLERMQPITDIEFEKIMLDKEALVVHNADYGMDNNSTQTSENM